MEKNNIFNHKITMKEKQSLIQMALIRVIGTYTIAGNAMFDAIGKLRNEKCFRHGIKYNANKALEVYYYIEQLCKSHYGEREDLLMSVLQYMDEDSQVYVDSIRDAVKRELLKHNINEHDSDVFAYVQTAKWLIDSSWFLYKKLSDKNWYLYGVKIDNYLRLNHIKNSVGLWGKVAKGVCVYEHQINLDTEEIDARLKEFTEYVASVDFINRNTFFAIRDLPKYQFLYRDGEYNELCKKYLQKHLHD